MSRTQQTDEFYIGWEETAPPSFGRRSRWSAALLLVLAPLLALVVAGAQGRFAPATFEFGNVQEFEGTIRRVPHPVLEVASPTGGVETWYLVAFGKHGADAEVEGFADRAVRLRGTLIYRDLGENREARMVEIESGSVQGLDEASITVTDREIAYGRHTLRGEIVDSKCWLGVMNPGEGKVHKACASLCIRGGIPPLLAVRGPADGAEEDGPPPVRQFLLVDAEGREVNDRVLDLVAEPVEVRGEVVRRGDLWTLRADMDSLRRLP